MAATDAREPDLLSSTARDGSADARRAALLGLSRLHDDVAVPGLVLGLRDEDPEARRLAAFGIGALESEAPPAAVTALLGAYAAEPAGPGLTHPRDLVSSVRATMVWSLARTTDPRAVPALQSALDADSESRVAACRGLAYGPPTGWPEPLLVEAVEHAAEDASAAVREACLQGLGRTTLAGPTAEAAREAALTALSGPAADSTEELRVQAARLLGRLPPSDATRGRLASASSDPSWRVAVAAIRALGAQSAGHEAVFADALRGVLTAALAGPAGLTGGALHIALAGLEAALDHARAEPVFRLAGELAERLDARSDAPLSRDRGWLHCAVARLTDAGRGWPGRVLGCGLEQIAQDEQRALAAQVIARGDGAHPQRAAYLERLLRDAGPRGREAALEAGSTLPLELALPLARAGLSDGDEGVLIAALELVRQLAPLARAQRDEAVAAAILAGSPPVRRRFLGELDAPLTDVGARISAGTSLEARITWATTLEALADPDPTSRAPNAGQQGLADLARPLAAHASHGVRAQARRTLRAMGAEPPTAHEAPPAPLDEEALALDAVEARLVTERGEIVIELFPDVAPTTVTRFVELAERGFFEGLTFHRVVPGFVAQGGDPRGDGYGGPDLWQRCEDNLVGYERGVVGMALAGRDTGGSQFFVALGPQHHLDGRYTAFGRVREGMEHADALQMGDPIRSVTIVRRPLTPPPVGATR